jgi:hypothetical protein
VSYGFTVTVPCIDAWYRQWYVKVPVPGNFWVNVPPAVIPP